MLESNGVYFHLNIQTVTSLGYSPQWPLCVEEREEIAAIFDFREFENEWGKFEDGFTYFNTQKMVYLQKLFTPIKLWNELLDEDRHRPKYVYMHKFTGLIPAYYRLTQSPFNVKLSLFGKSRSDFEVYSYCNVEDPDGLHDCITYWLWEENMSLVMMFHDIWEFELIKNE